VKRMYLWVFQDIYGRNFKVTDIQATQLTHVVYSFMNVNTTTGEVYLNLSFTICYV
jgi:GH18 family chitinase